jgi:hypothetical protein
MRLFRSVRRFCATNFLKDEFLPVLLINFVVFLYAKRLEIFHNNSFKSVSYLKSGSTTTTLQMISYELMKIL